MFELIFHECGSMNKKKVKSESKCQSSYIINRVKEREPPSFFDFPLIPTHLLKVVRSGKPLVSH